MSKAYDGQYGNRIFCANSSLEYASARMLYDTTLNVLESAVFFLVYMCLASKGHVPGPAATVTEVVASDVMLLIFSAFPGAQASLR